MNPESIGNPAAVTVQLPGPGWSVQVGFTAVADTGLGLRAVGPGCGRRFSTRVVTDVEGQARVLPRGPAGNYDVDLFVNPPRGGDLSVRFRWTTPKPGPANSPRAQASVLAHSAGIVDSVGVELSVSDLAATPTSATAAITVTAANGATSKLDLTRIEYPCADDGSVFFAGSKDAGNSAAHLGPQPFTYTVSLRIDGVPYEANARWPDEVDVDCAPCVPLRFSPPLPAFVVER